MRLINITTLFLLALFHYSYTQQNTKDPIDPPMQVTDGTSEKVDQIQREPHHFRPSLFREKFKIFREKIHTDPVEAGIAFLEIMNKIPQEKKLRFLERNYSPIADLLIELRKKDPDGKYLEVISILKANGIGISAINTIKTKSQPGMANVESAPRTTIMSTDINDNPINKLVEIKTEAAEGNTESAQKKMENLSSQYPKSSAVQTAVAEFFTEINNFQKAEDFSTKAINIDNENTDAYRIRAISKYSMNDVKGAIEDIKKATEIDPQDETNRLLNALIESKKKISTRDITSLKALKDAMAEVGTDDKIYLSGNSSQHSVKAAQLSQGVDYTKSKLYLKTAAAKNQMQDYEGALKYSNLAIEKNPDNVEAYIERANSQNFLGNYDEAIKDLSHAIDLQPSNVVALNMRAWALYKKGLVEQASEDATTAIKIKPDYADAMLSRSLSYEKQGKYAEMLADLEKASAINPSYMARYQDAVAQYAARVPNYVAHYPKKTIAIKNETPSTKVKDSKMRRFLTILLFTLIGGLLIGIGLLHIFSCKDNSRTRITHPDILSPSVFYEGVATGKYKILNKIGQGGMGIVYKATDQTLNREVAIKKMNDAIKFNDREKQRFIEEARTVAMLRHPNIIEIYTIFEEGEDVYLVFEYIDGETLDKKLAREVRIPFYQVKEITTEVAKALSYAHKKNIIHRDIKLSNIMISRDGFVKVMDFGLAKLSREVLSRISSTEIVGSPAYMAPEQEKGIFLKESDIYSLGVCIYEMLTGDIPFSGPDYHYQKENMLYTPLSASVYGLEKELDKIMTKILAPNPQERYKSIEEFLADFERIS